MAHLSSIARRATGEQGLPIYRWEWDKQPAVFLAALVALHREGVDFELAMLGSGGGRDQDTFREEAEILSDHIIHWGCHQICCHGC